MSRLQYLRENVDSLCVDDVEKFLFLQGYVNCVRGKNNTVPGAEGSMVTCNYYTAMLKLLEARRSLKSCTDIKSPLLDIVEDVKKIAKDPYISKEFIKRALVDLFKLSLFTDQSGEFFVESVVPSFVPLIHSGDDSVSKCSIANFFSI